MFPSHDQSPHLSFINLDGSARVDYDLDLPIRKMMFLGIKSVRNAAAEGGLLGDQEMALVKAYIFSFAELIESFNKSE